MIPKSLLRNKNLQKTIQAEKTQTSIFSNMLTKGDAVKHLICLSPHTIQARIGPQDYRGKPKSNNLKVSDQIATTQLI